MQITAFPDFEEFANFASHAYAKLYLRTDGLRGLDIEVWRRLTEAEIATYQPTVKADERRYIVAGEETHRWLDVDSALAAAARVAELAFPEARIVTDISESVTYCADPNHLVLMLEGSDPATAALVDGWGEGDLRWRLDNGDLEPVRQLLS